MYFAFHYTEISKPFLESLFAKNILFLSTEKRKVLYRSAFQNLYKKEPSQKLIHEGSSILIEEVVSCTCNVLMTFFKKVWLFSRFYDKIIMYAYEATSVAANILGI